MHSQFIMPSGSVKRKWLDEEDYDTWRQPVLPVVVASPALEKKYSAPAIECWWHLARLRMKFFQSLLWNIIRPSFNLLQSQISIIKHIDRNMQA